MQEKTVPMHRLGTIFIFISFITLYAVKPFTPDVRNQVKKPSTWHDLSDKIPGKILCITEGCDKSIWLGTAGEGVWKYDGIQFTNSGLTDMPIHSLELHENSMYAAGDTGVYMYKNNRWISVLPQNQCFPFAAGLESSNTGLWIGTAWGLFRIDGTIRELRTSSAQAKVAAKLFPSFRIITVQEKLCTTAGWNEKLQATVITSRSLFNRKFIFAAHPEGAALANGLKSGQEIPAGFKLAIPIRDERPPLPVFWTTGVFSDSKGTVWTSVQKGGVVRISEPGTDREFYQHFDKNTHPLLQGSWFDTQFAEKPSGEHIIMQNTGILVFDGESFRQLPSGVKLGIHESLAVSSDGRIWTSGFNSLAFFEGNTRTFVDPKNINFSPPLHSRLFIDSSERLWWGGRGLAYTKLKNQSYTLKKGILMHAENDNSEWLLTSDHKVVEKKKDAMRIFFASDNLPEKPLLIFNFENSIYCFGISNNHPIVSRHTNGTWEMSSFPKLPCPGNRPFLIHSRKNILIGSDLADRADNIIFKILPQPVLNLEVHSELPPAFFCCGTQKNDSTIIIGGHYTLLLNSDGSSKELLHPDGRSLQTESMLTTPDDDLWLGTQSDGVLRYSDNSTTLYDRHLGLPDLQVTALSLSADGSLLAGTPSGPAKYAPQRDRWISPLFSQNLPVESKHTFIYNSMKWTGTNKLITLNNRILTTYIPDRNPPQLTLLSMPPAKAEATDVVFSWKGNDPWSISPSSSLTYSTRLDDGQWTDFSSGKWMNYQNLPPGKHTFQLRARDTDLNITEPPLSVSFRIHPPVWKRPWFISMLITFLLIITILSIAFMSAREHAALNALELERAEASKKHEIDAAKLRMFTNLSHDFRTPLTLIINPLQKLLAQENGGNIHRLMLRNANRLLRLVNQILDIRKLDAGRLELYPSRADIISFISDITVSFHDMAENSKIRLDFTSERTLLQTDFDSDKVEKIIYNLISNALTYSPAHSTVLVSFKTENEHCKIEVSDTGPGISKDDLPHLFDRFYRSEKDSKPTGSGLGLSLSRELALLHGGNLTAANRAQGGACFTLTLPIQHTSSLLENAPPKEPLKESPSKPEGDFTLLIVEDTADVRTFLCNELSEYKLLQAENGKQGLELTNKEIPDLIISDVMMPEMDGLDLCKRVKNNELTSHIPVILLTARSSVESQLDGLGTGADDYQPKPFSIPVLKARIATLLENRRKLQQRYAKSIVIKAKDVEILSLDDEFLDKAMHIVETNMSDYQFGIETLAEKLGLSRAQFYRKIKAVTGKTAGHFIRTMRLQRAAQLLKRGQMSVSDTALAVGYIDQAQFSRNFKKEMGMPPRDYAKSARDDDMYSTP